jgi:hypothetical protein
VLASLNHPNIAAIYDLQEADDTRFTYDIIPDAKDFVVMLPKSRTETDQAPPEQINITLNWFEELKQRVPVH